MPVTSNCRLSRPWCLTLVINAVVAWTTEYYGLAVEPMHQAGRRVDDEVLAHISPVHSENINFFGAIDVDFEGGLLYDVRGARMLGQLLGVSVRTLSPTANERGS